MAKVVHSHFGSVGVKTLHFFEASDEKKKKRPLLTRLSVQIDTCKRAMGACVYVCVYVCLFKGRSMCATLI